MAKVKLLEQMQCKGANEGRRITQAEVAKATRLSRQTINKWCQGTVTRIEPTTLRKLTQYFGCKAADLVEDFE